MADVEKAYWDLVAARRDLDVRRGSLALAEQQRYDTQVRIEARTVAPSESDAADGGSRASVWDVFAAQEVVARAERALKLLMLSDLQDRFWAAELIPVDAPDTTPGAFDVARALADARKNPSGDRRAHRPGFPAGPRAHPCARRVEAAAGSRGRLYGPRHRG